MMPPTHEPQIDDHPNPAIKPSAIIRNGMKVQGPLAEPTKFGLTLAVGVGSFFVTIRFFHLRWSLAIQIGARVVFSGESNGTKPVADATCRCGKPAFLLTSGH